MSDTKIEQPLIWNLPVSASKGSETGRREENQDRMADFSSPFGMVYLIADGMGGHEGGAEAARRTAEGFQHWLSTIPADRPYPEAVSIAANETHKELATLGKSGDPHLSGMGSTVVAGLIRQAGEGFELVVSHMGDSRLYLHRSGQLTLLTRDHTQVQWLIDANEINEQEARSHPDASVLTRALGHGNNPPIEVSEPFPLGDGDGILLCSDGLSGFATSEEIDRTIKQFPEAGECVPALIRLALERGSNDNITVQFIRVGNQPPAIVPPQKVKRKTLPEQPAIAAAPVYRIETDPYNRKMLLVAAAIGLLLLAAGLVFAFRDRIFPAEHSAAPAAAAPAVSMDQNITAFREKATEMSRDATDGEKAADAAITLAAHLPLGRPAPQEMKKLKDLKGQFHKFANTADDAVKEAGEFRKRAAAHRRDPGLADEIATSRGVIAKQSEELKGALTSFRNLPVVPDAAPHARKKKK